jgi:hypothetical protein
MMPSEAFGVFINEISRLFDFLRWKLSAKCKDSAQFCQMTLHFLAKTIGVKMEVAHGAWRTGCWSKVDPYDFC